MVNVTDKIVPTGTYSFHNVKHNKVIDAPGNGSLKSGPGASVAGKKSDKWVVALTKDRKVTIRNGQTGRYASAPEIAEEEPILTNNEAFEWSITPVNVSPGSYKIYSTEDFNYIWSLPDADGDLQFVRRPRPVAADTDCFWTIQKEADIPGFGSDGIFMGPLPTLIPDAIRPDHKPLAGNNLQITVPKGWEVTVSGLALGNAINACYLQAVTKESTTIDTFQFYNDRDHLRKPMKLKEKEEMTYQAAASLAPIALGLTCYSSTNPARKDPFTLSHRDGNQSILSVEFVDKTVDVRNFPDFRKYYITLLEGEFGTNAVIIILISKTEGDLTTPPKPVEGTVNEGTNPKCDEPRPDCMDQYLKDFDSVFLVDDSGSMEGTRWAEAKASLVAVADEAMRFDTDGIGLLFFNSLLKSNNIIGEAGLLGLFDQVKPSGGTPTGPRLDAVLKEYIGRLDAAIGTPGYEQIKLLDLICITDGEPNKGDDPEPVLLKWAAHLKAKKHHPNQVGIQFVQVGDVATATQALKRLANLDTNGIVDTVPFNGSFTPERLVRVLLGGVMPNMRKPKP